MEASVADTAEAGAEPQAAEPTNADIAASIQQFGKDVEGLREHLATEPWKPAEEEETVDTPAEPEDIDYSFLNTPEVQADPNLGLQELTKVIRDEAKKIAAQEISPVRQDLQQKEEQRQLNQLSDDYPQLQDPKAAEELLALGETFVNKEGLPKELATHPGMLRNLYLASRARAQNEESGGDTAAANLEGAGGASPGGAGQGDAQQATDQWKANVAPKRLPFFAG